MADPGPLLLSPSVLRTRLPTCIPVSNSTVTLCLRLQQPLHSNPSNHSQPSETHLFPSPLRRRAMYAQSTPTAPRPFRAVDSSWSRTRTTCVSRGGGRRQRMRRMAAAGTTGAKSAGYRNAMGKESVRGLSSSMSSLLSLRTTEPAVRLILTNDGVQLLVKTPGGEKTRGDDTHFLPRRPTKGRQV